VKTIQAVHNHWPLPGPPPWLDMELANNNCEAARERRTAAAKSFRPTLGTHSKPLVSVT